ARGRGRDRPPDDPNGRRELVDADPGHDLPPEKAELARPADPRVEDRVAGPPAANPLLRGERAVDLLGRSVKRGELLNVGHGHLRWLESLVRTPRFRSSDLKTFEPCPAGHFSPVAAWPRTPFQGLNRAGGTGVTPERPSGRAVRSPRGRT